MTTAPMAASAAPDPAALRHRAAGWGEPIVAAMRARVRESRGSGILVCPAERPSGWLHDYVCGRCSTRLAFDRASPRAHRCPACGEVNRGERRDAAWVYLLNLAQIQAALEAGLVAGIDADAGAAAFARDVLLAYARAYADLPAHGDRAGKGRLQGQSLCEAVWMLRAIDVARQLETLGAIDAGERDEARERLFRPAIGLLRPQTVAVHNIHVWHACALASLGWYAGDDEAVAFAEGIIERNLAEGLRADGSWYEGSPLYHFYTAEALLSYVQAARQAGRPPRFTDGIARMHRAALGWLVPDRQYGWQFALLNDGWPTHPFALRAGQYEAADGLLGDREGFGAVLAAAYAQPGVARDSIEALRWGRDALPPPRLDPAACAAVDGVGVARRRGLTALLKANAHGGGHEHADQASLSLWLDGGAIVAGDLGNPGYGDPLHGPWFKTTAAHNAAGIDGRDHEPGEVALDAARDLGPAVLLAAHARPHAGVTIARSVVVGDGWAIDWTRLVSDVAAPLRWRFHADAPLQAAAGTPATLLANPHVERQRLIARAADGVRVRWRADTGACLHATLWPEGADVGTAVGPGLPSTTRVHLLIAATHGHRLDTLAAFAVGEVPAATVQVLERTPDRLCCRVQAGASSWRIGLDAIGGASCTPD